MIPRSGRIVNVTECNLGSGLRVTLGSCDSFEVNCDERDLRIAAGLTPILTGDSLSVDSHI